MTEEPEIKMGRGSKRAGTPPRLNNLEQVRREMSRLYGDARAGRISSVEASRLTFVLMNLARLLEAQDKEPEQGGAVLRLLEIREAGRRAYEQEQQRN